MVIFEKNGQGYFDFDFKMVEELTSCDFSQQLRFYLNDFYVKDVQLVDDVNYLSVYIYKIYGAVILRFDLEDKTYKVNSVVHSDVERIYSKMKELGVING